MQVRPLWLAVAIGVLIVGQPISRAGAQTGDAAATQTEELSAAQKKQQATRAAPQRRAPAASRAVRSTPRATARSQVRSTPRATTRSHAVRTTPKATVRSHAGRTTATPNIRRGTRATTRAVDRPITRGATRHVDRPVTRGTTRAVDRPITRGATRHVDRPITRGTATTSRSFTGTRRITRGPGAITRTGVAGTRRHIAAGPALQRRIVDRPRFWNGWRRPVRVVVIRDRWRFWGPYGWRTFVPFTALATFAVGAAVFYPAGYVSMPEPACTGITPDGNRLRWVEVPTEEGGSDWQCVAYAPEPNRVITELDLPDQEPVAAIPAPVVAPTVGAAPAPVPAPAAQAEPPAQARGCELTIYAEANLRGTSAPTDEDQADLGAEGWKDQIASIQVKSGTWDFFTGDNYSGEMMRLGPGSYTTLDAKWTRRIGSFMCSKPAGA